MKVWKVSMPFKNKLLSFKIVLDLQKNCEKSTEDPLLLHTWFPLLETSYISMVDVSQVMN